ncbi:MAG TPA: hypothetical protein VKB80_26090 [Kofleriaceae bacterium]|nr:hypothetical protein [Kofleriaceae bacterium]
MKKQSTAVQQHVDALLRALPRGQRRASGAVSGLTTRQLSAAAGGYIVVPDPGTTTYCHVGNQMLPDDSGVEADD